jgi:hypothetical protein
VSPPAQRFRDHTTAPRRGLRTTAEQITRTTNKITRSLAPALVMAALIAPTAAAHEDISSLDVRDVAEPSAQASGRHDLRSQDALDAARSLPPDQLAAVAEGLRSDADGSDVGLVSGGVRDLVRIGLAGVALFTRRGAKIEQSRIPVGTR